MHSTTFENIDESSSYVRTIGKWTDGIIMKAYWQIGTLKHTLLKTTPLLVLL